MFKFFEKSDKPIEQKEQKESDKLNVLVFDDSENQDYSRILDLHFNEDDNFPTKATAVSESGQISQILEQENFDVIFAATPDH